MISKNNDSDTVHHNSTEDKLDISFVTRSMNFQDTDIELLHAFMDAVPSILFILGTDQIISFVNDHFCERLGFTKKELIGHIWYDRLITPGKKRHEAREIFSKPSDVKDGHAFEIPIIDKRKEEHPAIIRIGYLNDRNGNVSGTIVQIEMIDPTSVQCIECAADDKYRVLVENSVDIVLSTDQAGAITYISPSVTAYGFTPEELLLKGISDIFFYEDQDKIARSLSITLNNFGQSRVQGRLKGPNEKLYWVELYAQTLFDKNGHVKGITAAIRDTGNRKADLKALEMASDMFVSQARSSSDAIVFSDPDGNIIFWNKGAENLFFYTVDEALGMHISMIMPQRYRHIHQGWDIVIST
ncbi:MAG: PAS domain S-box protein, partial [Methanomethylovorans sp.]|uniref:PAS domain S-box protein n=1 Tax=Methanomethylovorans sp. TaxID=2758717 RepID=UPI003C73A60A